MVKQGKPGDWSWGTLETPSGGLHASGLQGITKANTSSQGHYELGFISGKDVQLVVGCTVRGRDQDKKVDWPRGWDWYGDSRRPSFFIFRDLFLLYVHAVNACMYVCVTHDCLVLSMVRRPFP